MISQLCPKAAPATTRTKLTRVTAGQQPTAHVERYSVLRASKAGTNRAVNRPDVARAVLPGAGVKSAMSWAGLAGWSSGMRA